MMIRSAGDHQVGSFVLFVGVSIIIIHTLMNKHFLGTQLITGSAMELWCTCENAMTFGHRVSCILYCLLSVSGRSDIFYPFLIFFKNFSICFVRFSSMRIFKFPHIFISTTSTPQKPKRL